MAQVTNTSHDELHVPLFGLIFGSGETIEVDDEDAVHFGWPFHVDGQPAEAQESHQPATPVEAPAPVVQPAEAPAPLPAVTPAAPAVDETPAAPAGGSAQ